MMPYENTIKYGLILACITAVLGFGTYLLDSKYDEGFAEGRLEMRQDIDANFKAMTIRLNKEKDKAVEVRAKRDELETKLQILLRNPPPPEVTYVEVIKTIPAECVDLGPGIRRMWDYYANMSRVISDQGDQ